MFFDLLGSLVSKHTSVEDTDDLREPTSLIRTVPSGPPAPPLSRSRSDVMDSILKYAQKAQKAYNHYGKSEVEVKVLEATGKENWGVHGQAMKDIARHTRNRSDCGEIMRTLWQRLEHRGDEWRHVYKALTLMEFLVAHGDEAVTRQLQQNIYEIERLENFQYKEPSGRDQGINVRQKCQTLVKVRRRHSHVYTRHSTARSPPNPRGTPATGTPPPRIPFFGPPTTSRESL